MLHVGAELGDEEQATAHTIAAMPARADAGRAEGVRRTKTASLLCTAPTLPAA
jgi:hypothetical protein